MMSLMFLYFYVTQPTVAHDRCYSDYCHTYGCYSNFSANDGYYSGYWSLLNHMMDITQTTRYNCSTWLIILRLMLLSLLQVVSTCWDLVLLYSYVTSSMLLSLVQHMVDATEPIAACYGCYSAYSSTWWALLRLPHHVMNYCYSITWTSSEPKHLYCIVHMAWQATTLIKTETIFKIAWFDGFWIVLNIFLR